MNSNDETNIRAHVRILDETVKRLEQDLRALRETTAEPHDLRECDREMMRLWNERFVALEKRVKNLGEARRVANRFANRTLATLEGTRRVLENLSHWVAGSPIELVERAVDHHAARHLHAMLEKLREQNPGDAKILDDGGPDEIPSSDAPAVKLFDASPSGAEVGRIQSLREELCDLRAELRAVCDCIANYQGRSPDALRADIEIRKSVLSDGPRNVPSKADGQN